MTCEPDPSGAGYAHQASEPSSATTSQTDSTPQPTNTSTAATRQEETVSNAIYVWIIEKFPTDVHSPVWDSEGSAFYEVQRMARSLRGDSNLTLKLVHDLLMYDRRRDFGTSKAVVDSDGFIWAYVRRTTRRRSCGKCNRPHFSGGLCERHHGERVRLVAKYGERNSA